MSALGTQLSAEFGRGFGVRNLFRMVRFAEVFPDESIVSALRTLLGWTHFRQIIALDDPLKRDFYAEMCRIEKWNTRTLERKIGSMLFERTALPKKPPEQIFQKHIGDSVSSFARNAGSSFNGALESVAAFPRGLREDMSFHRDD